MYVTAGSMTRTRTTFKRRPRRALNSLKQGSRSCGQRLGQQGAGQKPFSYSPPDALASATRHGAVRVYRRACSFSLSVVVAGFRRRVLASAAPLPAKRETIFLRGRELRELHLWLPAADRSPPAGWRRNSPRRRVRFDSFRSFPAGRPDGRASQSEIHVAAFHAAKYVKNVKLSYILIGTGGCETAKYVKSVKFGRII